MKNLIYLILAFTLVTSTSCKKNDPEPYYEYGDDGYHPEDDIYNYYENDTVGYTNGGTIPTGTSTAVDFLVGTKWVLTSFRRNGYLENNVNDTIEFTDNSHYVIYKNGAGSERNYTINVPTGSPTGTYTLTLHTFYLFGSGADSYSGLISEDVTLAEQIYTDFTGNYYGDEIKEATFEQL
jgi:hypothetical protein